MSTTIVVETRAPLLQDDDLPATWQKVIANLENVAHFPRRLDPDEAPTVDDITGIIKPAKSDPTTKTEAKRIFSTALICIQRFGGMIAQGTSVVFGPSNQVFNAVSFLITVAQDTQQVFDNLTALMERLSAFLERLNYRLKDEQLDEKLPRDLRLSVYRVLEQFVTIMALSHKLTHTWRKEANESLRDKLDRAKAKAKAFIKVGAFGDDSGVKAAISTFERLVAEVSGVQIDSIHRNLSVAARNIVDIGEEVHEINLTVQDAAIEIKAAHGAILENAQVAQDTNTVVHDLRSRSDDEKDLKAVRDGLGILEKDAQLYEGLHKAYSNQTPGTGNWLFDSSAEFRKWMDFRHHGGTTSDILALQGPEGYGKSYLCHAVIHKLQREYLGRGTPSNVAICWYYFPKDTRKASMSTAMWHLIWQLAKADKKFLKHLKSICAEYLPNNREDATGNWNRLVLDYSIKSPATVFFVVIDGLDHVDADEDYGLLAQIIQQSKSRNQDADGLRIRFLISGRETAISEVQEAVNKAFLSINVAAATSGQLAQLDDLERYVDTRLGEMRKFQGTLSAEQERLRSRILAELPSGSRGNYNALKRKLNDIANSTKATEVNEVLERLSEDNDDDIDRGVRILNDKLSGQDIEQLNEILLWVSVAKGSVDGPLLDNILSKTFRDNKLYDPVTFVRQNCSKLLEVDENKNLRFPSSSVENYLRKAPAMRDTVPAPQIDLIQAMLRTSFQTTFGGLEVYHKFDFDQFFNDKRDVQTTLVHLNPDANNDHLKLLEYCLTAICDVDSSESTELLAYAKDFFDEHLTETSIDKVNIDQKQRLGQRLFRILREDAAIDRWATEEAAWSMLDWFDDDNNFCAAAINWLKDADVWKSVQSMTADTAWISHASTAKYERLQVLQHVACRVLQHWYTQDIAASSMQFRWLRGYFQKAGSHDDYREKTWFSEASLPEMQHWEEWAKTTLSAEQDEAQWHLLMADVLEKYGSNYDDERDILVEACNRCDKAMEHDRTKWQAQMLKGQILRDMEDYAACINQFEHMAQEHVGLLDSDDKFSTAYWKTVIPNIADCHMKLMQFDTAAIYYRQIAERIVEKNDFNGDATDHLCAFMGALHEQQAFGGSLDFLRTIHDCRQDGKSILHTMLGSPYADIHRHILTLAHRAGALADMEAYYVQAIQAADASATKDGTLSFMEFSRLRLQWYCGSFTSRESIMTEWEAILETMKQRRTTEDEFSLVRFLIVRQLGRALLETAKASGVQSVDTKGYAARLHNLVQEDSEMDLFLPINSKLTLARLLHLSKDKEGAKEVLRDEVRKAIKQVREEEDPRGGYELLASIFPVLDDDVNAYAAWLVLEPNKLFENIENTTTDRQQANESSNVSGEANGETGHDEKSNGRANGDTDQVVHNGSSPVDRSNGSKTLDKSKLRGSVHFVCDGGCGRTWRFADDIYVCKDCLCVQLDPACYEKLKAGTLDISICNPAHAHMHIPPWDVEAWQALDPKMMRFGSTIIGREEWLQNLENEWELEQELPAVDGTAESGVDAPIEASIGNANA